jgi:uncharacterized membrane protein YbaN (DUF454 family)
MTTPEPALPEAPHPSPPRPRSRLTRPLWLAAGLVLVGVGAVGVFVPGLPTTVFFIGAAACFARSSPRLEQWVLELPRVGPLVRDYRNGLGMPRRAKIVAALAIAAAVTLSAVLLSSWGWRAAVIGVGLVGVWYVLARVPTQERVRAARGG